MKTTSYYLTERPDTSKVIFGCFYWFAYLVLIPSVLTFLFFAVEDELKGGILVQNVFFIGNFAVCCFAFRDFLSSSLWNLKYHKETCVDEIISALGMVPIYSGVLLLLSVVFYPVLEMVFASFPIYDSCFISVGVVLLPEGVLLAILCIVFLVPVTIGCLYYGVCFAPLWERKPWMGYVGVAVVSLLPQIYLYSGYAGNLGLGCWLVKLPIHLYACRLYLRTNTVWCPIIFLAVLNALSILLFRIWFQVM